LEVKQLLTLADFAFDEMIIEGQKRRESEAWLKELRLARQTCKQLINRPDPGAFFLSALGRSDKRMEKLYDKTK
jgi:hypothetical protein